MQPLGFVRAVGAATDEPATGLCEPLGVPSPRRHLLKPVALPAFLAASIALLALVGIATAGPTGKPAGNSRAGVVRVATSGNYSERIKKLPIGKRAGQQKRVVMSLGPKKLPRLRSGDRLKLSSEVQFTLNCTSKIPRCIGPPYRYSPKVTTQLILARSASSKHGLPVTRARHDGCQQHRPREHHCVFVIGKAGLRIGNTSKLPCPPDGCFVNLVVSASNPDAGGQDVLIVGGNKPSGAIPQDRGRINAVLLHPAGAKYPHARRTRDRVQKKLPLDLKRRVVYSQRLNHVEAGDQIAVDAKVVTERAGLPYSVRTSSQLILGGSRHEAEPGPFARRLGGRGEIGEANGFNCTRDRETCTTHKVGVLRIARSARLRGKFRPVFVNVVMIVGPKRFEAGPNDRYDVLRRGGLSVTRYAKPRPPRGS